MTDIFNQGTCSYCGQPLSLGDRFRCEIELNEWASPSPRYSRVLLAERQGPIVPLPLCQACRQLKLQEHKRTTWTEPVHVNWVSASCTPTPYSLVSSCIVSNHLPTAVKSKAPSRSLRLLWLTVVLLFLLFLASLRR